MQIESPDVRANRIIEHQRARWPRWRNSSRQDVPRWFRGHELDALDPQERRALYDRTRVGISPARWTFVLCAMMYTLYRVHKIELGPLHWPSLALIAGYLVLLLALPLIRRWMLLRAARAELRESADWPRRLAERPPPA